MRVVECECPFGGERIICYFTAVERVDFRGLVKDLAREYRTRIEMRQVGARDEARLLADFETCGREVCCKSFLKTLKPISMRMAKLQKSTLDPTQVSGRCGRLKCCLHYENVGYEELDKRLPRNGARVHTSQGEGVVISRQVLTQLLQIRTDADVVLAVSIEDLLAPGEAKTAGGLRQPAASPGPQRGRRQKPAEQEKPAPATPSVEPRRGEPDQAAEVAEPDGNRAEESKSPSGTSTKRRRRRGRGRRNRKRTPSGDKPGNEGGS
ncbi:MAG: hypothetical protein KJ749_07910, partial [Planctomycetes bacterium]|nr:hypothetical protein [Planctomycetota bacterium]